MVRALILQTSTRALFPLMLVFSAFLLARGHNEPGGGFAGGLVAATAYALVVVGHGVGTARRLLRLDPRLVMALGLGVALGSALLPWLLGGTFFEGLWLKFPVPVVGKLGTPFLFDIGVYLAVLGVTLTIVFELAEESQ
jgi:multicomponent Na+:H+ antiporter subunit B